MITGVLIPTSGKGTRIGAEDGINKALLKIDSEAVISRIIGYYENSALARGREKTVRFFIMLGYDGDNVRQYVTAMHPELDVVYLDQELETGPVGFIRALKDQRGLLSGLDRLFFHASDTIFSDKSFDPAEPHAINVAAINYYAYTDEPCGEYRTLDIDRSEGRVFKIMEKGEAATSPIANAAHIGVVRFQSMPMFWGALDSVSDDYGCDAHILNMMISAGCPVMPWLVTGWEDTGNVRGLFRARNAIQPTDTVLPKPGQEIYTNHRMVVKRFDDCEALRQLRERGAFLKDFIPKQYNGTKNYMSMEFVRGELARDVFRPDLMLDFLDWCQKNLWSNIVNPRDHRANAINFYSAKTVSRINQFEKLTGIPDGEHKINYVDVGTMQSLIEKIPWDEVFDIRACSTWHGDLHPSNIIVTEDGFKLIDWRGTFGKTIHYGDVYYDLAKLLHGLIVSHDIVDGQGFEFFMHENFVTVDILRHHRLTECETALEFWAASNGYSIPKIHLLCALIFLNIAPLHPEPEDYNKFLFFLGKSMLHSVVNSNE